MKKILFMLFVFVIQASLYAKSFFPEGTRWTEIRLDTLKYDDWYSKVDGEWVPNYEVIEYYVQGEYAEHRYQGQYEDFNRIYTCVYTNGPGWADSLTFFVNKGKSEENIDWGCQITVAVFEEDNVPLLPGTLGTFTWQVGTTLESLDILSSNTTGMWPCEWDEYGTVEEIKEGFFGGVRPLKYSDVNGLRFIQTIGVTTWNDGECIFGPIRPYEAFSAFDWNTYPYPREQQYRSMLVHFERDGEVLYDVWPEKEATIAEPVTYTAGQMATIIMPTAPDAGKGKYYRLDRVEGSEIVFEQELQPRAHVPYIIVPSEDFCIDLSTLDLAGLNNDTVSTEGVSFIGTYSRKELNEQEGFYIDIIDKTPDCSLSSDKQMIGALRAYLLVTWDDPYNHGGTKVPTDRMEIVLHNNTTGIKPLSNSPLKEENIYDLNGINVSSKSSNRKLPHGIYIKDGRKEVIR